MERSIIHFNVADFAVAVERLCDRRLVGRPVVVAAGNSRALVYDMSDEAWQAGVRKGTPLAIAKKHCRDLRVLAPRPDLYQRATTEFFRRITPYSPLVEPVDDNGHFFVDVTGSSRLFGPPPEIAWRIRNAARRELGLNPIWTVAPNKLVAKVASRLVKPTGEYIVAAGEETDFLAGQHIALLPGLHQNDLTLLRDFCICSIGELARLATTDLTVLFGARALPLHELARGIDPSPVLPLAARPPVIRAETSLAEDSNDRRVLESTLRLLCQQAGAELRAKKFASRRLSLFLQYSDDRRHTGQAVSRRPLHTDQELFVLTKHALERGLTRRVRVRTLRLVCDRLCRSAVQLSLFDECHFTARDTTQNAALDAIKTRFGTAGIQRGRAT